MKRASSMKHIAIYRQRRVQCLITFPRVQVEFVSDRAAPWASCTNQMHTKVSTLCYSTPRKIEWKVLNYKQQVRICKHQVPQISWCEMICWGRQLFSRRTPGARGPEHSFCPHGYIYFSVWVAPDLPGPGCINNIILKWAKHSLFTHISERDTDYTGRLNNPQGNW